MSIGQQAADWDVVIVGGGITGLAAARKLAATEGGRPLRCLLLEGSCRLGGTIETVYRDGFVIEKGPDAFLTEKPWALDLAVGVGLRDELVGTDPGHRRSFVARGDALLPVPPGFYLIAPSEIAPFLASPILSPWGKARLLVEPLIPRRRASGEESVASFVRRRMGRETYERIAQPMVGGIYTGDPERLSAARALPKFVAMERERGSVLASLLRARSLPSKIAPASGPRYSLFASFKEGMESLVLRAAKCLGSSVVRTGQEVSRVSYDSGGGMWRIELRSGESLSARAVLSTAPAHRAAAWFEHSHSALSGALKRIEYESVVTVSYAFNRRVVGHPLNGFGFVVPKGEARVVIAGSFSSVKFAHRAPEGGVLIRIFAGGAFGKAVLRMTDEEIAEIGEVELGRWLRITGPSLFKVVSRHSNAMPQAVIGHEDRVGQIRKAAADWPGLEFAGASYDGVGIPECVRQGEEAALKLKAFLSQSFKLGETR